MNHIIIFTITGYMLALLLNATALNISNVPWRMKQLILMVTSIYIPQIVLFHDNFGLEGIFAWIVLTVIALCLFFKLSLRKSLFIAFTQYFISLIIDYIGFFIINQLADNIRFALIENLLIPRLIGVLLFVLMFIFTRQFANKEHGTFDYLTKKYWAYYLTFFLFVMIYELFHITEFQYRNNFTEVFVPVLFFAFFICSLFYIKADQKLENILRELESQKLYAESQNNTLNDLRRFKHGVNAIFNTISGLVDSGDITELKSYIGQVIAKIKPPQASTLPDNVKKIPLLRGILAEKLARAELNGIKFNITIDVESINLKYCSDLDYSQMISILADNALEAAEQSVNKTMDLVIKADDGQLVNIISNSCDTEVDISRIFEQGYSTKSNPSGQGLYQLCLIQDKYKKMGYSIEISSTYKDGNFTQILRI